MTGRVFTGDWTGFKSAVRFISMLLKETWLPNCLITNVGVLGIMHRKKCLVSVNHVCAYKRADLKVSFTKVSAKLRVEFVWEGLALRRGCWHAKPFASPALPSVSSVAICGV